MERVAIRNNPYSLIALSLVYFAVSFLPMHSLPSLFLLFSTLDIPTRLLSPHSFSTNTSLQRTLPSARSVHRHAVREQSKHRLAEHPIAHRAERNRRVFKRRIAQTHILFAHIRSPHGGQLPQHHRAPPVFLQFRHHDFDALDELRSKRLQSLTSPSETSSGSSRSTSTALSLLDRQT